MAGIANQTNWTSARRIAIAAACFLLLAPKAIRADESSGKGQSGEEIYRSLCASCHGNQGQGVPDQHDEPLIGDRSVLELASIIEKTMPEGEPEKCVGEDAHKVASYIHDAFYSPVARERNRPARIELSRLTVRQYQNSVADLVGSFRQQPQLDDRRGLSGEYYKNRRFRSDDRVLERIDAQVNFDFGTASPAPGKTEDHEFSIRWEGSLFAPDTGEYEVIVRTDHAARLWLNDMEQPLIDAWVKSGNETEYRGSIRLLGGRWHPLRLEFSKAKQGVDDSDKKKEEKPESKPATMRLCWKQPKQAEEPVPERYLSPVGNSEVFVLHTPFPPDDRSIGYERGSAVSKEWDSAATDGALEVAAYVAEHLNELAGIREARRRGLPSPSGGDGRRDRNRESESEDRAEERARKVREFSLRFVERAFRRPLSEEQQQLYIDRQLTDADDPHLAVKRIVLLALKSPRFLYHEAEGGQVDAYDVASRLSFALWDSLPDEALREAAASGKLTTREEIESQARRLLADVRAKAKIRQFMLGWLKADQMHDLSKDPEQYGEFGPEIATDLRTSLELTLDDIVWSEASDFRQLLISESVFLNGRLAKFYGVDLPEDASFQKLPFDAGKRAGVLTHPLLLSGFAYTAATSPIHRGVFVARSLLGRSLRPPPEAVSPLPQEVHPDLTTRERVALQTKAESCAVCHEMINPLGFTLEHFDAVGRYRSEELGRSINAEGGYLTRSGEQVKFQDARQMAAFLAGSQETHAAFVEQLFHHLVKQPLNAFGSSARPTLQASFADTGYNIQKLAIAIATLHAQHGIASAPPSAPAEEKKP